LYNPAFAAMLQQTCIVLYCTVLSSKVQYLLI